MPNIVHFGKYYYPEVGGIENVTLSLAEGAVRNGYSVSVICFQKTSGTKKEIIDGVRLTRVPIAKLIASQPLGFKYFLYCLLASRNADIIHLHVPNMLGALCALFIPRKTRLLVHWHSDVLNKGILGFILRPLESALLNRANKIVSTSQTYADESKTLAPFKEKIIVSSLGIPDANYNSTETQLPSALELKLRTRKIILGVGRLVPYKGFSVLIHAAQKLVDGSVVVIVGSGPLFQELQQEIIDLGVGDRVILTGKLDADTLEKLFKRAYLFCLTSISRAEAFGVVLLEAMSHGLPIVSSKIPGSGVTWVNQDGFSGISVPIGDAKAVADACNKILLDNNLRDRLSDGARKRFNLKLSEKGALKRMMIIYKDLLATK